ncbi:MAG: hypothetical protein JO069_06575 [Verrucomicrobia bacterium]|nr:hypothetical protein [Verrucomicrobiota bacterium]
MNESDFTSPDLEPLVTTELQLDADWTEIAHDEACKAEYECLCVYLNLEEFTALAEVLVDECSHVQAGNVLGCFRGLLQISSFLKKHLDADDIERRLSLLDAALGHLTEQGWQSPES